MFSHKRVEKLKGGNLRSTNNNNKINIKPWNLTSIQIGVNLQYSYILSEFMLYK